MAALGRPGRGLLQLEFWWLKPSVTSWISGPAAQCRLFLRQPYLIHCQCVHCRLQCMHESEVAPGAEEARKPLRFHHAHRNA